VFGGTGNDSIDGNLGNDFLYGQAGTDTLIGGAGTDTLTGGADADDFVFAAGQSDASVGGNLMFGTISGFDVVTDFTPGDELVLAGAPSRAANTGFVTGTMSTLWSGFDPSSVVAWHGITEGVVSFRNLLGNPITVDTTEALAAVVQYLQSNDLGNPGVTVALNTTVGGSARAFVYQQVGDTPNPAEDLLIQLNGVTVGDLDDLGTFAAPPNVAPVVSNVSATSSGVTFTLTDNDSSSFTIVGALAPYVTQPVVNGVNTVLVPTPFVGVGDYSFGFLVSDGLANSNAAATVFIGTDVGHSITFAGDSGLPRILYAFGGNDTVTGNGDVEYLFGGDGDDTLNGARGDDTLDGGADADTLTGGTGADTLVFAAGDSALTIVIGAGGNSGSVSGFDVVTDFDTASDKLDFGSVTIAANLASTDGVNSEIKVPGTPGQFISQHSIVNGVVVFFKTGGDQAVIEDNQGLAAAVDYLHRNGIGAGNAIAIRTTVDGTSTFIYQQTGVSPSAADDLLVKLTGVDITNLNSLLGPVFDPIVLDLDGNGIDLSARAAFDLDADGTPDHIGWVGSSDGILVMDLDGSGAIEGGRELVSDIFDGGSFRNSVAALASLDSNGDGFLTASDARFGEILVWRDLNSDGVTQQGELATLADHGIESISLGVTSTNYTVSGTLVFAEGSYTLAGGDTRNFAGVRFADHSSLFGDDDGNVIVGTSEADLLVGLGGADLMLGQGGDDVLIGGEGDDILVGGPGLVTMTGGAGVDIFVIDPSALTETGKLDVVADYEHGTDRGIFLGNVLAAVMAGAAPSSTADVAAHVTLAAAGSDTDVLVDGVAVVRLTGIHSQATIVYDPNTGAAANVIMGTAGDDYFHTVPLMGTSGADAIFGLGGTDVLIGQGGDDVLNGGEGDDTLVGGPGKVTMIGGAGIDIFVIDPSSLTETGKLDIVTDYAHGIDRGVFLGNVLTAAMGGTAPTSTADVAVHVTLGTAGADTDVLVDGVAVVRLVGAHSAVSIVYDPLTGASTNLMVGTDGDDYPGLGTPLIGTVAADILVGLDGNDMLLGQGGNDVLIGGEGSDTLVGGAGLVTMYGGAGADVFVIDAAALSEINLVDVIADYDNQVDIGVFLGNILQTALGAPPTDAAAVQAVTSLRDDGHGNTEIVVDSNGAMAGGEVAVAVLTGVHDAVRILYTTTGDMTEIS
jgi:Ca2+-binding RTX toxin-like protein